MGTRESPPYPGDIPGLSSFFCYSNQFCPSVVVSPAALAKTCVCSKNSPGTGLLPKSSHEGTARASCCAHSTSYLHFRPTSIISCLPERTCCPDSAPVSRADAALYYAKCDLFSALSECVINVFDCACPRALHPPRHRCIASRPRRSDALIYHVLTHIFSSRFSLYYALAC